MPDAALSGNAPLAEAPAAAGAQPADGGRAAPLADATDEPNPETYEQLVASLEGDAAPRDEYEFRDPLAVLRRAIEERGGTPAPELVAEELAFAIHAHDHQDPSTWGLYFGPMMSGTSASGEPWDSPALSRITGDVLAHWRRRAEETAHPVMRARYADLLWELPKKLDGVRPDPAMARAAVDAYLDAVDNRRFGAEVTAVAKAERALTVALEVGDTERAARARDVLLALEDAVAEDESPGLWGFCFDTFVEPPNKRVPLTDARRDRLVADMEARLARFAGGPPDAYHPGPAEAAARRLAAYYRRRGLREDVVRVLRAYGEIVRRMRGTAAPLVAAHSLETLYELYRAFAMHADADALNEAMREAGAEAVADMKEISVTAEIPKEKVDAYFAAMLEGTATEVLQRLAVHFVPKRAELEPAFRDLARKAPVSFLLTHTIKDEDGRTVAVVGPLDADFEGQYVRHVSQHLHLSSIWLREAFRRGVAGGLLPADVVLAFLLACPLFRATRRPMLASGLAAFVAEDSLTAIHLLVPQVEQAVRHLAVLLEAPIYTPRKGGGLHARTLDDLLRDPTVGAALGADVTAYLRLLLTDARGWNVRNTVCHGLAPAGMLTMGVADRVVHAALVLALLREKQPPTTGDADDEARDPDLGSDPRTPAGG